jgi:hypothetical protein
MCKNESINDNFGETDACWPDAKANSANDNADNNNNAT